ncbi:hypothetical protein [Actinomadura sp. GTD37]|uniref:hypothetical protein n=1 Tax=Actinomadura sp. GTD37 TaxID=1778030 RepID=UPI0035BFFF07
MSGSGQTVRSAAVFGPCRTSSGGFGSRVHAADSTRTPSGSVKWMGRIDPAQLELAVRPGQGSAPVL